VCAAMKRRAVLEAGSEAISGNASRVSVAFEVVRARLEADRMAAVAVTRSQTYGVLAVALNSATSAESRACLRFLLDACKADTALLDALRQSAARAGIVRAIPWMTLPTDVLDMCLAFIPPRDILTATERVCKSWHAASTARSVGNERRRQRASCGRECH
jgi:hypothetical protein